jgi:hypothetical protein
MKFFLVLLAVAILMSGFAFAQPQTLNIPLKPSYMEKLPANVPMSFMLPLSGFTLGKISNAVLAFDINIDPSSKVADTIFYITIDKQDCINNKFDFIGTGSGGIKFDCSNIIIDPTVDYNVELTATSDLNSISAQGYVTYEVPIIPVIQPENLTDTLQKYFTGNPVNNSVLDSLKQFYSTKASMHVGGTDYWQGEKASVFLQLLDSNGNPITNASCLVDIYNTSTPYSKIYNNSPMFSFSNGDGMYIFQFSTVGFPEGVYPVDATCSYNYASQNYYQGSLAIALNYTITSGSIFGGSILNVNFLDDGLYFALTNSAATNATYTWYNVSTTLTRIDFQWFGETDKASTITFYAFNWTSGAYLSIGSLVSTASASSTVPSGLDDAFIGQIPDLKNFVNSTGAVRVQIFDNQGTTHKLYENFINLLGYSNTTLVTMVKGESEVHIYSQNIMNAILNSSNLAAAAVWNYTNRTLTDYNSSQIYQTLLSLQANQNTMNATVAQILALSSAINLTTQQTLNLAQTINLTTSQILTLAQSINATTTANTATLAQILFLNQQINATTIQIQNFLTAMNLTLGQVLALDTQINITTLQNKGFLQQINVTTLQNQGLLQSINNTVIIQNSTLNQILGLSQQINTTTLTTLGYAIDINGTVYLEKATLSTILGIVTDANQTIYSLKPFITDINQTVHFNAGNISLILGIVTNTNLTANQILSLAQALNLSQNVQTALLLGINGTIGNMNQTLQDVNATVHVNQNLLNQILGITNDTNQTVYLNKQNILDLLSNVQQLNLTSNQILTLVQAMNLSDAQEIILLNQINATVNNITIANQTISQIADAVSNLSTYYVVLGTEYYKPSDSGKIWIQILQNNNPVNNAVCSVNVYAPNLTKYINAQAMTLLENGIYYANITSPASDGTYISEVICTRGATTWYGTGELHVSTFLLNNITNVQNTLLQVNGTVSQINLTTLQNQGLLNAINLTTLKNLGLLQQINLTTLQNLGLAQQINTTTLATLGLAQDINSTVYLNKATLATILGLTTDTNATVYMNKATLQFILQNTNYTNATVNQILSTVNTINGTVALNQQYLIQLIGFANDTNSTVHINSGKLDNILGYVFQINVTTLQNQVILNQINITTLQNQGYLISINNSLQNLNVSVNLTPVMNELRNINATVNLTYADVQNILGLSEEINSTTHYINITAGQILNLVNELNLTDAQEIALMKSLNFTVNEINQTVTLNNGLLNEVNLTTLQSLGLLQQINLTTIDTHTLLQNVNLTVGQILGIVQELNLSDVQELSLLNNINATLTNHTALLTDINNTVYMNKATLAMILALATTINATTLQNFGLLVDINGTVYTNTATLGTVLAYVNDTNATVYMNKQNILDVLAQTTQINITTLETLGYAQDINNTVYINKAGIQLILSNLADVNQTVYMNKATLANILGYVSEINLTTLENLGLLQDVNGTVYMNKATLNTILGIANDTNNTAYLDYLLNQQINGTVNYNQVLLNKIDLSTNQTYTLLQSVNTQVFLNSLGINSANQKLDNLTNLSLEINMTTGQIYLLLQNLSTSWNVTIGNLTSICNSTQIALDVASAQIYPTQNGNVPTTGAAVTGQSILGGIAYAAPYSGVTAVCLDNSTLMETTSRVVCVGTSCQTYSTNQTSVCQYGCNADNVPSFCNPSPSQTNWYFFIIIGIILIVCIIAVAKLR